jgi:hypothetical protein
MSSSTDDSGSGISAGEILSPGSELILKKKKMHKTTPAQGKSSAYKLSDRQSKAHYERTIQINRCDKQR